jgi:hypothetical protein
VVGLGVDNVSHEAGAGGCSGAWTDPSTISPTVRQPRAFAPVESMRMPDGHHSDRVAALGQIVHRAASLGPSVDQLVRLAYGRTDVIAAASAAAISTDGADLDPVVASPLVVERLRVTLDVLDNLPP